MNNISTPKLITRGTSPLGPIQEEFTDEDGTVYRYYRTKSEIQGWPVGGPAWSNVGRGESMEQSWQALLAAHEVE
jgi:hypothetical protein